MRCPFLREAQVKFCHASAYRKMIVRGEDETSGEKERCSTADYAACPLVKELQEEIPERIRCPFLQGSLVQYCSASPVTKFIPYSATAVTRCGNDNHHYCELYFSNTMSDITFAAQKMKGNGRAQVSGSASAYSADGLSIPGHLWYAPNHLWLDISPDSRVHVGVDGFMARALGPVDRINYVTQRGHGRPTAVLTLAGVDLHIVFPATMMITGTNSSLRNQPGKLSSDPYTLGWLFEGVGPVFSADGRRQRAQAALLSGERAAPWMQEEVRRLVSTLQEFQGRDSAKPQEGPTMADGGSFTEGVLHLLEREEILAVYNEFFSSYAAQRV